MECAGRHKSVAALCDHLSTRSPLASTSRDLDARRPLTFRLQSGRNGLVGDWEHFIAQPVPRSQLEALSPFARWEADELVSPDGEEQASWAAEYSEQDWDLDYDVFPDASARWSPEFETAREATRRSSASPALSSSSYASTVPTDAEALRICCDRGRSLLADCCDRAKGLVRSEQESPHPLTFHAGVEAEWDFDRMFSRRGRLGKRRAVDLDEPPDTIERAHVMLRDTAMKRLGLIAGHMGVSA